MKALIVEDDITNRKIVQKYLEPYAQCDAAANGNEALVLFRQALQAGSGYDLVCLDIMMPEVDGHGALRNIREFEQQQGVAPEKAAKIIMVTALDDLSNVVGAFKSGCEAYVVKPIDREKLYHELRKMELIK